MSMECGNLYIPILGGLEIGVIVVSHANVTTNADNYGTCYDANIVATNVWWTIRGEGFYPYSVAGIYWDGADQGVSLSYDATSATANGYYYTRSTAKESCGNMNTSIPGSTQYTYHNFYDVCRTPV